MVFRLILVTRDCTEEGLKSLATFLIGNTGYRSLGTSKIYQPSIYREYQSVYTSFQSYTHPILYKIGDFDKISEVPGVR